MVLSELVEIVYIVFGGPDVVLCEVWLLLSVLCLSLCNFCSFFISICVCCHFCQRLMAWERRSSFPDFVERLTDCTSSISWSSLGSLVDAVDASHSMAEES